MLFFLHHCELPSLDHRNAIPVILHLHHPQPPPVHQPDTAVDTNLPQGENIPQAQVDSHIPNEEESVLPRSRVDVRPQISITEEESEEDLLRPQLHRTSDNDVLARTAVQESQLTDEELRKIRLQRFEKSD